MLSHLREAVIRRSRRPNKVRCQKQALRHRGRKLIVESLEDRRLLTAELSIGDASVTEGGKLAFEV